MRDGHDGKARAAAERPDQIEGADLVGDVEGGGGFIQKNHLRFLRKRPGDQHPLPLAPAQGLHEARSEGKNVRLLHGGSGDGKIPVRFKRQTAYMRAPPHQNDLLHSQRKDP
ncbi:MAG: hypothetical protein L6300_07595 [Syntrophaceae bacterium]|nr:hypothetical protein [Syntrophaceae bacterium]